MADHSESYGPAEFSLDVQEELAWTAHLYDPNTLYRLSTRRISRQARTILKRKLTRWDRPTVTLGASLRMGEHDWEDPGSLLDLEPLRALRRNKIRRQQKNTQRAATAKDTGSEDLLQCWMSIRLELIIRYALCLQFQELYDAAKDDDKSSKEIDALREYCRSLEIIQEQSNSQKTAPDFLVSRICNLELKVWTFAPECSEVIDTVSEQGAALETDAAWKSATQSAEIWKTAQATIAQVTESLTSKGCPEGILFCVYGSLHWYQLDKENNQLKITANLTPNTQAQRDNALRVVPETYITLVKTLLEYGYKQFGDHFQQWLAHRETGEGVPKAVSASAQDPSPVSTWFRSRRTAVMFGLTPSVYSEHMRTLPLDGWWRSWIPSFVSYYIKLQLLQRGNNALVWVDRHREVVFKQYYDEVAFCREVGFLRRLATLPWIPRVLGTTTSLNGIWGIFLGYEGEQVTDAFEIVEDFAQKRNILRRRNGSLVLIDFEQAVEADECSDEPCPDIEIEWD
ncbi:hypothetical protein MD484_g7898, partial [Candolleomyces efflorescens]